MIKALVGNVNLMHIDFGLSMGRYYNCFIVITSVVCVLLKILGELNS